MEVPKVCYITSDEPFLVSERIREIKDNFISEHMDINYIECSAKNISDEIEAMPFIGNKKMLCIDVKDNDDTAKLLSDIPDYCHIIVVSKLDKRKKTYKAIKKHGEIIELKPYKEKEMVDWIIKKSEEMEMKMTKKAANQIIKLCGISNMYFIYHELLKLASMKEKISEDVINKVVTKSPEYNAFILTDTISKRDKAEAFRIIKVLSEKNEFFPLLLSNIQRNFAVLHMMKTMSESEIKKNASIHPFVLKKSRPFVNTFSIDKLERLMNLCSIVDFEMKNGVNHRLALEKLIAVI